MDWVEEVRVALEIISVLSEKQLVHNLLSAVAEDEKDLVAKNGARIVAGKHVKNAVDDEDREKKSTAADNLLDNYMGNMITIALILDEKRKREEQQMKDDELHQSIRNKSIKVPLLKKKKKKGR